MTSRLFSPLPLADLVLDNRIVASPMCQYAAAAGSPTPWHLMLLGGFATSGAGLVIIEATGVEPEGRITHQCLGLWNDAQASALAELVAQIRSFSSTPLGLQLGHAGRKASAHIAWEARQKGEALSVADGGWPSVAPSALAYDPTWQTPVELDAAGLRRIRQAYVDAALRAHRAGIDLLEVHAAHGYLLSQFLSPLANQRSDAYGGSLANRMRFPLEVMAAVRDAWPAGKPVGVRVNGSDWVEGGWLPDDCVAFAHEARRIGLDYVVTSGGNTAPGATYPPLEQGYMIPFAERVKREVGIATMGVGLIVEPRYAEQLIASGAVDAVALGRGFLDDPHWPLHAAAALGVQVDYPRTLRYARPSYWRGHSLAHPPT
jgi:2,4-dienoyl-CoA reductase-like NADH-dependent reductase (Old Yellow Enzyme family)